MDGLLISVTLKKIERGIPRSMMVMKEISSSCGMSVDFCVGDSELLRAGIEFENSFVQIMCRKCSLVLFGVVLAAFLSLRLFGK